MTGRLPTPLVCRVSIVTEMALSIPLRPFDNDKHSAVGGPSYLVVRCRTVDRSRGYTGPTKY